MTNVTTHINDLRRTAKEALLQARQFEEVAEKWRLEAEQAYEDAGSMKAEGRARAARQNPRMLPSHERGVDVRTNSFKAVADVKGDVVMWLTWANTYATLAQMKYAKAAALNAEILTWLA